MKDNKGIKGFTLVELILVLAFIILVISLAFNLFVFGKTSFDRESEKNQAVANARCTMDFLSREIRKATEIELNDNVLTLDGSEIKCESRTLYKDAETIISGIDNVLFSRNGNEITIEVHIILKSSKDYRLTSIVALR